MPAVPCSGLASVGGLISCQIFLDYYPGEHNTYLQASVSLSVGEDI